MKILFIGTEQEFARLDHTILQHNIEAEVSGPGLAGSMLDLTDITNVTDYVLDKSGFDYIMYDVRMFINEPAEIAKEIRRIERTNSVPVLIAAFGCLQTSALITELVKVGYKNIIIDSDYNAIQRSFNRCITGYYEKNDGDERLRETFAAVSRMSETVKASDIQYIAVAGTQSRIGCTTQAMQLVKYLNYKNQKACYISYGSDSVLDAVSSKEPANMFDTVKSMYKKVEDLPGGGISYNGIDMYKVSAINTVRKNGYTHLVYDFGAMTAPDFSATGFMDKDAIKVIVAGIDEKEIGYTDKVLDKPYYYDAHLIFSFVAAEDQREVKKSMLKRNASVHFAEYTPDKYTYNPKNNAVYEGLIPLDEPEKKQNVFGRIFKKKGEKHA